MKIPADVIVCNLPVFGVYFNEHIPAKALTALLQIVQFIRNPAAFAFHVIQFLHFCINRVIETGDDAEQSSTLRQGLKGFFAIIFGLIKAPITVLHMTINIAFNLIQLCLIDPMIHLFGTLKQAIKYRNCTMVEVASPEVEAAITFDKTIGTQLSALNDDMLDEHDRLKSDAITNNDPPSVDYLHVPHVYFLPKQSASTLRDWFEKFGIYKTNNKGIIDPGKALAVAPNEPL